MKSFPQNTTLRQFPVYLYIMLAQNLELFHYWTIFGPHILKGKLKMVKRMKYVTHTIKSGDQRINIFQD